jgi:hypothetical protein
MTTVSSQWPCSGAYCRSGVHFTDNLFTNKNGDDAKRWTVARRKYGRMTANVAVISLRVIHDDRSYDGLEGVRFEVFTAATMKNGASVASYS